MSKASQLKALSDADLEALRHEIRRDAKNDLQLARWVEEKLGSKIGENDAAKCAVIYRYRKSDEYRKWLDRWLNQDARLKTALAAQAQRFELLKDLVGDTAGDGMVKLSNALLGRLLASSAEMTDEELQVAAAKGGFLKPVIAAVQADQKARERERLASAANQAMDKAGMRDTDKAAIRAIFKG